jgi:hypothetical protein
LEPTPKLINIEADPALQGSDDDDEEDDDDLRDVIIDDSPLRTRVWRTDRRMGE